MALIPGARPGRSKDWVDAMVKEKLGGPALCVVGCRGYYLDSMGRPGVNDRGIYDDAFFIVGPEVFIAFNANTDPSAYRKGRGFAESTKGMAKLKPGVWSYQVGPHRGYTALVQADQVTVIRDGSPDYEDTGWFGINIHKGGASGTSSLGCQTIVPEQWESFISTVRAQMKIAKVKTIPYILIEQQG